jgi:cell division protease FtsH
MGMGKSRAKMLNKDSKKATFKDVAGIDEAKAELEEIVDFLSDPSKYHRLGGKLPRGVLLVGPPGTGKTLTARAVAGEAKVPFYSISGSDFVEMFVGVGASRVRDMFEQAKKSAPCIVFIDELDAVGRRRGAGMGGGNDEREQTLNQMLVEMDGFDDNESVIIMAATNRPDVLDPALLRPGRFDRQVVVPNPDIVGREAILRVHVRKTPMAPDVDINVLARGTPGFSGADLANLVNEASLLAVRRNNKFVHHKDFEDAKDKVMMGTERRSMVLDDKEKLLTAYHEAGHAIAAIHSPASDPIHKATIVPRGRALGMVMRLPKKDRVSMSLEQIKANLVVGIGGRLAEEIIFGEEKITTGASSDIQMMTDIARRMVMEWGYSKKIGTIRLVETHEQAYLSGSNGTGISNVSEEMSKTVDAEILRIIEEATKKCKKILTTNRKQLDILAKALIKYETLSGDEIDLILKGKKLKREEPIKAGKRGLNDTVVSSSVPTTKPNLGKDVNIGKSPVKSDSSAKKSTIKADTLKSVWYARLRLNRLQS